MIIRADSPKDISDQRYDRLVGEIVETLQRDRKPVLITDLVGTASVELVRRKVASGVADSALVSLENPSKRKVVFWFEDN